MCSHGISSIMDVVFGILWYTTIGLLYFRSVSSTIDYDNILLGNENVFKSVIDTQHLYCHNSIECEISVNIPKRRRRELGSLLNPPWSNQLDLNQTTCCQSCSCLRLICVHQGNCCPDAFFDMADFVNQMQYDKIPSCTPLQTKPRTNMFDNLMYPNSESSIDMYTKCPFLWKLNMDNEKVTALCEADGSVDLLENVPVTDETYGKTYKNKYCAVCNGVVNGLRRWTSTIVCRYDIFTPTGLDIIQRVLDLDRCNIIFTPGAALPRGGECTHYISSCNVTGNWQQYDAVIEEVCGAYSAPYLGMYRNVFCYLCNGLAEDYTRCNQSALTKTGYTYSFVIDYELVELLNASGESNPGDSHCIGNTIYDPLQEKCTEISCIEPWVYVNGVCVHIASKIGGVHYEVFIKGTPSSGIGQVTYHAGIKEHFLQWLNTTGVVKYVTIFSIHTSSIICDEANFGDFEYFVVHFRFFFDENVPASVSLLDTILDIHQTEINVTSIGLIPQITTFQLVLDIFEVDSLRDDIILSEYVMNFKVFTRPKRQAGKRLISEFQQVFDRDKKDFNPEPLLPIDRYPLVTIDPEFYNVSSARWGVYIFKYNRTLRWGSFNRRLNPRYYGDIRINKSIFDDIVDSVLSSIPQSSKEPSTSGVSWSPTSMFPPTSGISLMLECKEQCWYMMAIFMTIIIMKFLNVYLYI